MKFPHMNLRENAFPLYKRYLYNLAMLSKYESSPDVFNRLKKSISEYPSIREIVGDTLANLLGKAYRGTLTKPEGDNLNDALKGLTNYLKEKSWPSYFKSGGEFEWTLHYPKAYGLMQKSLASATVPFSWPKIAGVGAPEIFEPTTPATPAVFRDITGGTPPPATQTAPVTPNVQADISATPDEMRKFIKLLPDSPYSMIVSGYGANPALPYPVTSETNDEYNIDIGVGEPFVLPKNEKDIAWEFATQNEPAPSVPIPLPETARDPEFPYQYVYDGPDGPINKARIDRINDQPLGIMGAKKLPKIYNAIKDNFVWIPEREDDADIFLSIFLIKNGSLVLKGIPGTGKTQLIEMSAMCFANDIREAMAKDVNNGWIWKEAGKDKDWVPGPNATKGYRSILKFEGDRKIGHKSRVEMVSWLMYRGIVGVAKHNPDKEIQDIFFTTNIAIEKYSTPRAFPEEKISSELVTKEQEIPAEKTAPAPAPAPVPIAPEIAREPIDDSTTQSEDGPLNIKPISSKQTKWKFPDSSDPFQNPLYGKPGFYKEEYMLREPPDEVQFYEFQPIPRGIVTSLIKFHNEANRMSGDVADVLLGLMAEREVEFQNKIFFSPSKWNENLQIIDIEKQGKGALNFFDYNPHLEVEHPELELDRALLDRITAGIYLSGGNPATKFQVLNKTIRGVRDSPRDRIFQMIVENKLDPILRQELEQLWDVVSLIPIDPEIGAWISFLTNIPNLANRKYGEAYRKSPIDNADFTNKPIDRTMQVFRDTKDKMQEIVQVTELTENIQSFIDQFDRPLGARAAESMLDLYRAYKFLTGILNGEKIEKIHALISGNTPEERDKNREARLKELLMILPRIVDHRVNLGVGDMIKDSFMSTFDAIAYHVVPHLWENKELLKKMMEGLMAEYVKNQNERLRGRIVRPTKSRIAQIRENVIKHVKESGVAPSNFDGMLNPSTSDYNSITASMLDLIPAMF